MVRALELFSGTGSVGKVLRAHGWETVSLDIDPRFGPDLCMNILDFDETAYPRDHFDAVWASCPCEAYSKARSNAIIPRDVVMTASDKLVVKTRQIIAYFTDALWILENPATSLMWTREAAKGLMTESVVTSYCAFGFPYQKNTRLANNFGLALPRCAGVGVCPAMVGRRHGEQAQRGDMGARAGPMARCKTRDELHSIPPALIEEILRQVNYALLAAPRAERGAG